MKIFLILPFIAIFFLVQLAANSQNCPINCPDNIVVRADSGKGGTYVTLPKPIVDSSCGIVTYTPGSGSFFTIGSSSVIVTTASGTRCSFTVTVTDNEPPSLSPVTLSSKRIWPANGKMKELGVRYTSSDNANETSCTVSISSNDAAANGQDGQVVDAHQVRLRALRLPNGMARVYMITVTCTDAAGNTTKRTTGISVAKNVSPKK